MCCGAVQYGSIPPSGRPAERGLLSPRAGRFGRFGIVLSVLAISLVTQLNLFGPSLRGSHLLGTNELQQPYKAERLDRGEKHFFRD